MGQHPGEGPHLLILLIISFVVGQHPGEGPHLLILLIISVVVGQHPGEGPHLLIFLFISVVVGQHPGEGPHLKILPAGDQEIRQEARHTHQAFPLGRFHKAVSRILPLPFVTAL